MQALGAVTTEELLQRGQEPLLKLEIFVGGWIDICDLDSKNYLESISISHGGAGMSPDPIATTLTAEINNEGGIFHPHHPDSAYTDYFKVGRQVKISVGAMYGGVPVYWQRIIGYIDTPTFAGPTFSLTIAGFDYTSFLINMAFRKTAVPPDNYWGSSVTRSTKASDETTGAQKYNENDAMEITADAANVTPWTRLFNATITSQAPGGAPSTNVGQVTKVADGVTLGYAENYNVGAVTQGKEYKVSFWYKGIVAGDYRVGLYRKSSPWAGTTGYGIGDEVEPTAGNTNNCYYECTVAGNSAAGEPAWPVVENGGVVDGTVTWATRYMSRKLMAEEADLSETAWTKKTFYFTATDSCDLKMRVTVHGPAKTATRVQVDKFSIRAITGWTNARYSLPPLCTGVFFATLDGETIWPGEQKGEGWFYDSVNKKFYFSDERNLAEDGTDNLVLYYFKQQAPEDVVADILVYTGLYANRAAALAAMGNPSTGITIDQVWFEAGSSFLSAIKLLCERCDYRFHFEYDGIPVFKVFSSGKPQDFEDLVFDRQHIANPEYYEDRNEIRNRIVIEGVSQALPEGAEETVPSELKGTLGNQDSIDEYGERFLSIKNHLFQDQDSIDNMCTTLLRRYKDPMWYVAFSTPFNPAPLEVWDMIVAILLLKTVEIHGSKYESFKYDSGTKYGCGEIAVGVRGLIRDIKIDKYNITYKCEEVP